MKYNSNDSKNNMTKYGKNTPHKAWLYENVSDASGDVAKEYICSGDPIILYDGRYCAVAGFVFAIVGGKFSVLANKRGPGTPDFQGYWNCPCGYLEKYESSIEGIAREIYEECAFAIDMDELKVVGVETRPEICENGNVTIRHTAFVGRQVQYFNNWNWLGDTSRGGEENEVAAVRWVPIDHLDEHRWAFNHKELIRQYAPPKFKRFLLELLYKFK
jgi:8-oxo-dGTP pyrophosphatase MutT (NUDIX family)